MSERTIEKPEYLARKIDHFERRFGCVQPQGKYDHNQLAEGVLSNVEDMDVF